MAPGSLLSLMLLTVLSLLTLLHPGPDPEWERVVDLRGQWRFQLGDDLNRARASYDDKDWETIFAPDSWEDEGFWGYDGIAWYRTSFALTRNDLDRTLYLHLGRIDDADQVWVNGRFIGSTGRFPESQYETGYFKDRAYALPTEYLRTGANTIAVRVYDDSLEGGILDGRLGVYALGNGPDLAVDLAGAWDFQPSQAHVRTAPRQGWTTVTVPAKWEPQGFARLNGYAWYRRDVFLPARLRASELILVLGRIDDLHEVWINGRRVGGAGNLSEPYVRGTEWQQLRAYRLDATELHEKNELIVRVFDAGFEGGIYDGPVGIMTEAAFERWRAGGSFLERIRGFFRLGN